MHPLANVLQTGKRIGMCTMDDSIEELLKAKKISPEDAFESCANKEHFVHYLPSVPEEWAEVLTKAKGAGAGSGRTQRGQRVPNVGHR